MAVDELAEVRINHEIRYAPEHSELRFYDDDKLCCSINLATGKGEFHGNYKPDAISKIFWACVAAAAPEARAEQLLAPLDIARIKRTLVEFDTVAHLMTYHASGSAEDHNEEVTEEAIRECRDLEYVINWLHPNYVAPAFPDETIPARDPDDPEAPC
jgi:hypothetical protein